MIRRMPALLTRMSMPPRPLDQARQRLAGGVGIGQVGDLHGAAEVGGDGLDVGGDVEHPDDGAGGGERPGDLGTDAPGGAGDDRSSAGAAAARPRRGPPAAPPTRSNMTAAIVGRARQGLPTRRS